MSRLLYSFGIVTLLPWAVLHLLWRSRRQPEYLRHWGERFGLFPPRPAQAVIWIHAVSVGETRAAQPLVAALGRRYPGHRILFTHMTPTGRATSEALFGDQVQRVYLPYDLPWAVRAFLDRFRPVVGLIMETELWPNLIAGCRAAGVPLLLVNGRLSERSARRYGRFARLSRQALQGLAAVAAQGEDDARRLGELGGRRPLVLGNMKFDMEPPPAQLALGREFRARLGPRPVFLCASTREGEEALILDAWPKDGAALLVIVPRHPQRFEEVAALTASRGFALQRRSDGSAVAAETQVWLGDSMGELIAYYAACDLAFVGGSLLPYGSQNLIEPCAVGVPVLIGPSTYNFADAVKAALGAGAALSVGSPAELVGQAKRLLSDTERRQRMAAAGREFAARHKGATERTLALIAPFIPEAR
jgi:3-deoxy-D-manno-octulosonic-acid transferase